MAGPFMLRLPTSDARLVSRSLEKSRVSVFDVWSVLAAGFIRSPNPSYPTVEIHRVKRQRITKYLGRCGTTQADTAVLRNRYSLTISLIKKIVAVSSHHQRNKFPITRSIIFMHAKSHVSERGL